MGENVQVESMLGEEMRKKGEKVNIGGKEMEVGGKKG
jgi:hypothetical protein